MFSLRAILFAAGTFVVLFGVCTASLRFLLPHLWRSRVVRIAFATLGGATLLGLGLWTVAFFTRKSSLLSVGTHVEWIMLALVLPLTVALVLGGLGFRLFELILLRRRAPAIAIASPGPSPSPVPTEPPRPQLTRRAVLQWSSSAVPAMALSASTAGLLSANSRRAMPELRMTYAGLPADLEGLRILQLTDLHLQEYVRVSDVEAVLGRLDQKPDLIVFTGDVADDLRQLLPALKLAAEVGPRLGVYASVGNHEYFHRINEVRRIFDKSPVNLLYDAGTTVRVGSTDLYIAGVADPVRMSDVLPMLEESVELAMDGAPSDAFHLLLSHRPDGFLPASARGVELTLSGHTHGGQVGIFGRSAFEPFFPNKFLRGDYQRGKSRLYTSAGFGHWLPFRLNCPAEAPTIVLARA
jgi:predicted MPP superfamily phosphohydrolase